MNNYQLIRVMVADDHASVRHTVALTLLAFDDIEWVGEAMNGGEAVDQCLKIQPDVILMDLFMPHMDGVTAISIIRQQCPEVKIIAFTSFKDKFLVNKAIEAGADTYLFKDVVMDELVDTIRSVSANSSSAAGN